MVMNMDITKTVSYKYRKYINGKTSTRTDFYKYGYIEHFGNRVIAGDINIKYIGLVYNIAIINNHLIINYSSTNIYGHRHFTTSKSYDKGYESRLIFDKELDIERVINVLSVRVEEELINKFMELANYILEWHLIKEHGILKVNKE